jgi:iron uptake system component EfeO
VRQTQHILAAALALACAALLAACGSSSGGGTATPASPTKATPAQSAAAAQDAQHLKDAVASYRTYLADQSSQLATAAQALSDAIAAGDLGRARAAYLAARPFYEHIAAAAEYIPVAHQIDPQFLNSPVDSTVGFHLVEHGLWAQNTTDGLLPAAQKLAADCAQLRDQLPSLAMDPLRMTEAYELLDKAPISSRFEIEPHSHADLVDHQAHVEGSRVVFDLLRPSIAARFPDLATKIEAEFADVGGAMTPYKTADGFVAFTTLSQDQRVKLGQAFGALDEVLSNVKTVLQQPLP